MPKEQTSEARSPAAVRDPTSCRSAPTQSGSGPRSVLVGESARRPVTGYPAEVGPGWLEPLLSDPGRVDVALHIEPVPQSWPTDCASSAAGSKHPAGRRERGRLDDPEADAAADDAALASGLARGTPGSSASASTSPCTPAPRRSSPGATAVSTLAASLLLDAAPATLRSCRAGSTLPLGLDALSTRRSIDTDALAAAFPFTCPTCRPAAGHLSALRPQRLHRPRWSGTAGRRRTTTR